MTLTVTPIELVARAEASGNPGLVAKHSSWPRVPLSDVATVVNGAAFKSSYFNLDGLGMPLIRIRDVGADTLSTWYDGPWDDRHLVRKGDLIVGMDGDFRIAKWRLSDALLNQRVCRIDVDETKYDPRFMEIILQGYLDLIWSATSSTTVKHLSSRSIQQIPLPNPPLREQRRIVELVDEYFTHLDAAQIYSTHAENSITTLRLSWLARHLTPGKDDTFQIREMLLESRGGWSRSQAHLVDKTEGIPYVKMNNITRMGQINVDDLAYVHATTPDKTRFALRSGDILFNSKNSLELVGKAAVVDERLEGAVFNENIMRLRFNGQLLSKFVSIWFQGGIMRDQISKAASASTNVAAVYFKDLAQMSIWVPPLSLQMSIVQKYEKLQYEIQTQIGALGQINRHSLGLRKSVLCAAFSGHLDSNNYPAEHMKESILA